MKCKFCGKENENGAKFCMWCGQVFEEQKSSTKVQPTKISPASKISTAQGTQSKAAGSQSTGYQSKATSSQSTGYQSKAAGSQSTGYQSQGQSTYNNQNTAYQSQGQGTYNNQNTAYQSQGQGTYNNQNTAYQSQGQGAYNNQQQNGYYDPYGQQNSNLNGGYMMQSPPIHTVIPNYDPRMDYTPIGMWGYFGYSIGFGILLMVPILGWVIIALIAFGAIGNNINLRNFARSYFCWIVISVVLGILVAAGGITLWSVLTH